MDGLLRGVLEWQDGVAVQCHDGEGDHAQRHEDWVVAEQVVSVQPAKVARLCVFVARKGCHQNEGENGEEDRHQARVGAHSGRGGHRRLREVVTPGVVQQHLQKGNRKRDQFKEKRHLPWEVGRRIWVRVNT